MFFFIISIIIFYFIIIVHYLHHNTKSTLLYHYITTLLQFITYITILKVCYCITTLPHYYSSLLTLQYLQYVTISLHYHIILHYNITKHYYITTLLHYYLTTSQIAAFRSLWIKSNLPLCHNNCTNMNCLLFFGVTSSQLACSFFSSMSLSVKNTIM